jgi:septal ring factor EnvC (AmiA/AmiB activator)
MEVVRQITKEQLETITKHQKDLATLLSNIGLLETQKHSLLHQVADVNRSSEEFKAELEKQYGAINIDLSDGSYTEIEPDQNKA